MAAFVAAILASPLVPRQFFPSSDRPELLVDITLPTNASIYASEDAASRLDAALKNDPDVAHWSTNIGRGAIRFYLPLDVQLPNDFFTQAVVVAKDVEARKRLQAKLEKLLARAFPGRGVDRVAARAGAAGRLAGAVSRQRSRHRQGAGHRAPAGADHRGRGHRQAA